MLHLNTAKKIVNIFLQTYQKIYNNVRYSHIWSSKNTRQQFLDYFIKDNDHNFIRSSPVVPFCDPTVAFVNAGMNQFKGVFLGRQEATLPRAANSQKCVRVGGKHNDLNIVGSDGYHHTFFEMLGNWSFGDYFKKEACELAWNLLTGPYRLPPSALYVTYFGGDSNLHLEPDLECKEIWLSLGLPENHIIPFGLKDNFWEMGSSGPCGPCTEIHIDLTMSTQNRSNDVNKDLPDLTELWNIVFIQYNRDESGQISLLPKRHIDTGMGLERLTTILQGKNNNYETDIFSSLFKIIKRNCPSVPEYESKFGSDDNSINTAYRILTDHARTVTVCLADGMIPEQNQKLRKILRKCLHLSETVFKRDELLNELSYGVAENLGETYPEIIKNIKQVQEIISYEQEVYRQIRQTASRDWALILKTEPRLEKLNAIEMPGLIAAFNELYYSRLNSITPEHAFTMYDTHGLDVETISQVAQLLELPFDSILLEKELESARRRTKESYRTSNELQEVVKSFNIPKTDDSFKYEYYKDKNYIFKNLEVKVLKIIKNNELVDQISENEECYLVLDTTNLYTEAGGQISDIGTINFNSAEFKISDTLNINGYILHKGVGSKSIKLNDKGVLSVDKEHRLQVMSNHTATHLLNAAIKQILNAATCQKSSTVLANALSFDVGIYSKKLTLEELEKIEKLVRQVVKNGTDVETKLINSQDLLKLNNITMIPGEVYPDDNIRLININDKNLNLRSCEPCCGTHVLNTSDIEDFCITNNRSLGRSTVTLTAVTGERAKWAHKNGQNMLKTMHKFQQNKVEFRDDLISLDDSVAELRHRLIHSSGDEDIMPIYVKHQCLDILNEAARKLRGTEREHLKELINLEMKTVLETNIFKTKKDLPFVVHFLGCSSILDNVPLQHATKACPNVPCLVLSYSENMVKARCCVPKDLTKQDFNAYLWLKSTVGNIFRSNCSAPKGQNGEIICNMKAKRVNSEEWENLLPKALDFAKEYAEENL